MTGRNESPWGPQTTAEVELKVEDATCHGCGKTAERSALHRVQGQLRCAECTSKPQAVGSQPISRPLGSQPLGPPIHRPELPPTRTVAALPQSSGSIVGAIVGGLIGALIGAAIWAAIGIAAEVEIAYVAILLGVFAAIGVKSGAGGSVPLQRLLAVVTTIAGIVAAKYAIFAYVAVKIAHEGGIEIGYFGKFVMSKFPELYMHLTPYQLGREAAWPLIAVIATFLVSRPATA